MLRSLETLEHYKVSAKDGDVGTVANFLFDDERWTIRYLVVETGSFFRERRVLISPISFGPVDFAGRSFLLDLTLDKIRSSPGVDLDRPVSRQREGDYYRYYGYPYYWGAMGLWGTGYDPTLLGTARTSGARPDHPVQSAGDTHLRSALEVQGYAVRGTDERFGTVADFIVDDRTWALRYVVVDTGHWWKEHKVLVAPDWATTIRWEDRSLSFDVTRKVIEQSPPWDAAALVRRDYETELHRHYGRDGYWTRETAGSAEPNEPHAAHA